MSKKSIFYTTADLNYSDVSPTLDLNFVENQKVPPFVNVTRNSQTTYVDKFGILRTADINQPVFEWDPITGKYLGVRIWGAVTNEVRNSNNYSAVVTGSPGTLPTNWSAQDNSNGWTRTVVGTGTVGALGYVDIRFNGTPTGSQFATIFQPQGAVAASNGQSWTASVFHQLVAGSLGNVIGYPAANLWNSSNSFLTSLPIPGSIIPSTTMQRFGGGETINQANTAFISWGITFVCTAGSTYDFTIRFAGPQLQTGSTLGPYVPTTTTAASSTADVWSITGADFSRIINQTEGTIYIEYGPHDATTPTSNNSLFTITDGTISAANIIESFVGDNIAPVFRIESNGVNQAYITSTNYSPSVIHKLAAAYKADDFVRSLDTQSIGTDTSGALPAVAPSILEIGTRNFGGVKPLNGYIRRLTIYPKRLTNSQLVQLTE